MATNYEALLKLTNFVDARVQEVEDGDGNRESCVVIPLEKNCLKVSKSGHVYAKMFVSEKAIYAGDGYSHYLQLKVSLKDVGKFSDLGYKTPYLGRMRPSYYSKKHQADDKYGYNKVKKLDD